MQPYAISGAAQGWTGDILASCGRRPSFSRVMASDAQDAGAGLPELNVVVLRPALTRNSTYVDI
jgi:hypothetical protein